MMFFRRRCATLVLLGTLLVWVSNTRGQVLVFDYTDFEFTANFHLQGRIGVTNEHLLIPAPAIQNSGGVWHRAKVSVAGGFTTTFQFQITNAMAGGADGLALVIQNNRLPALRFPGGLGYDDVPNSLAVEFDTLQDAAGDPDSNHVSVHSRGALPNSTDESAALAPVVTIPPLADGQPHTAKIVYAAGLLQVFVDDLTNPLLSVSVNLASQLGLDHGLAWIGITGSTGTGTADQEMLSWSLALAPPPVSVNLTAPADGAIFLAPATINLTAVTSNSVGTVTNVQFFQDDVLIGETLAPPWSFAWTNVAAGTYTLLAIARDDAGGEGVSLPVRTTVAPPAPAIGLNFSSGSLADYPVAPGDFAGCVRQNNWNNVTVSPGGSATNLLDGAGLATSLSLSFTSAQPGEIPALDPAVSPDHTLMKAFAGIHTDATTTDPSNFAVTVSQVPYPRYDVLVYSDGDNAGEDNVAEFVIDTQHAFLRDARWTSFSGAFAPAAGAADLGTGTPAGNLVRFAGLTNREFTLNVTARSTTGTQRVAAVNAIQIIPQATNPPPALRLITRGPYLQNGSPTAVTVRWRTDLPCDSRVRFGASAGALELVADDATSTTEHSVTLTGLSPDTRYFYSIGSTELQFAGDESHYFTTAPVAAKPARIWAMGDSGFADAGARAVRDGYEKFAATRPADLWLMLGDNAYLEGLDSEYQSAVFEMYPQELRQLVLWPVLGNHDTALENYAPPTLPYFGIFTLPQNAEAGGVPSHTEKYYSFNYGNIHFVCLDAMSSDRTTNGPMFAWLQGDLTANTSDWLIACWHHPPYSFGTHNSDEDFEMIEMRETFLPLLEANGADLVLCGHSHGYERSFLLDGHYGYSSSFDASMAKDAGTGRPEETGAYRKTGVGPTPHQGTVYVVAGNGSRIFPAPLDDPIMPVSLAQLGSMVVDIDGQTLVARMIDTNGVVADSFTILKGPNTPPSIALLEPSADAMFTTPASLTLKADAADEDGLHHVEFFADDISLGISTSAPPCQIVWSNAPPGTHHLRARAVDVHGLGADSAVITVTVTNPPPTVVFQSPLDGSTFVSPAEIILQAAATDADGIERVEFFADGVKLDDSMDGPVYSIIWSNVPPGQYALTARATDRLGAATDGSTVIVTVLTPPGFPAITQQPQNQFVIAGANASFIVTATGAAILSYQWDFNGTDLVGETSVMLSLSAVQAEQAGSYHVTVANGLGSVTSAPAALSVAPAGPITLAAVGLPDGRVQLQLTAPAGPSYAIETSSDFTSWTTLTTVANPAGTVVVGPFAPEFPTQFYRARLAP